MRDFEISFNPGRFNQVLDNLTMNSEYWIEQLFGINSGNGRITIEINDPELIFYDNGPGVRPDLEESIFDLFQRERNKPRETGLGYLLLGSF